MATVTGYTATRMKEIEDATIIAANVVSNHLLLTRFDGTVIDAGVVNGATGAPGPAGPSSIIVCTSTTRPTTGLYKGLEIYETNTNRLYQYNGASWDYMPITLICSSTTRPANPLEGQKIYENDTDRELTYSGAAWIVTAWLGGWSSYVPVITQGSTVVNKTILEAKYQQVGRTVHCSANTQMTGVGAANGIITVTLPIPAGSGTATVGSGYVIDYGVSLFGGIVIATDSTHIAFYQGGGGPPLGLSGSPMPGALAVGDAISWSLTYEV